MCGVFGVRAPDRDVARLSYFGLYALQHRGQESAGIAVSDGDRIVVYKDMGLVAQVFDEAALNTLRRSNFQIATLNLPGGVQQRGSYNVYSDSYGPGFG